MHLNVADSIVTGDLVYMFFEKDKNQGKIIGKMRGDTLVAKYHFISEGVLSTRDAIFLKKKSTWTEGFGEIEEKAGSTALISSLLNNSPQTPAHGRWPQRISSPPCGRVLATLPNQQRKEI